MNGKARIRLCLHVLAAILRNEKLCPIPAYQCFRSVLNAGVTAPTLSSFWPSLIPYTMVLYNFQQIAIVPNAQDLVELLLSRSQRKIPPVASPSDKISRFRQFYMIRVKLAGQTLHDKLTQITEELPVLQVPPVITCLAFG